MTEWIKCSDRLPDVGKWVLVFSEKSENEYIITSCYLSTSIRYHVLWNLISSGCGCCDCDLQNVTHWMPLLDKPTKTCNECKADLQGTIEK